MCGRFTLTIDPGDLREAFPDITGTLNPTHRFNIAPTQPVAVVPNTGEFKLDYFTWGLIPSWAKDPSIGSRLINARSETLLEKPSFRSQFRRRRCLILADGFFEWQAQPNSKAKRPFYIYLKDHKPFAFAGLWDIWASPDGSEIRSCTIITTEPNQFMQPIHNRMPVILPPEAHTEWLDPVNTKAEELSRWLVPFHSEEMFLHPVSRLVNWPNNDTADCIQPSL